MPTMVKPDTAFIVSGQNFPDALSGGPFAAYLQAPIVLTTPTQLHPTTERYVKAYLPDAYYILGGTGAVSTAVENKLKGYIQ
jgi:putative cell wall-binding protein